MIAERLYVFFAHPIPRAAEFLLNLIHNRHVVFVLYFLLKKKRALLILKCNVALLAQDLMKMAMGRLEFIASLQVSLYW